MDNNTTGESFLRLVNIMNDLREKCPWDKKQTIQTLRQLTIEETYELTDAITDENWNGIKEELGDLMLHLVFYSKIGAEKKHFTLDEVINGVCDKLIHRHPHIYGNVVVADEEEVKQNWEKLKLKEGKKSILSGVPKALPAIVKAMRLQEKAKQVGFEWENANQVWDKIKEEEQELVDAIKSDDKEAISEELGDYFFSIINFARFLQVDAEDALERTNKKFINRFTKMENEATSQGLNLMDMSLAEMDEMWNRIKKNH
jgi:MazG family protein